VCKGEGGSGALGNGAVVKLSEKQDLMCARWLKPEADLNEVALIDLGTKTEKNYLKLGLSAELQVYQDLVNAGFNVHKSDSSLPYDLLAEKGGKCLRLQVKHTSGLKTGRSHAFKTSRSGGKSYTKNDADIFALVVTGCSSVYYCPVEEANKPNLYINSKLFEKHSCDASRNACFAVLNELSGFDDPDRLLKKRLLAAVLAADSFCIGLASDFGNEIDSDGRFGGLALVEVLIGYALKSAPKNLLEAVRHEPLNGGNL